MLREVWIPLLSSRRIKLPGNMMAIGKRSSYILFSVTQESTKHLYYRPLFHYTIVKLDCYRGHASVKRLRRGRMNRRVHLF